MAKKITKAINSQFIPTYIGGYPLFAYGGRMRYQGGGFMVPTESQQQMIRAYSNNAAMPYMQSRGIPQNQFQNTPNSTSLDPMDNMAGNNSQGNNSQGTKASSMAEAGNMIGNFAESIENLRNRKSPYETKSVVGGVAKGAGAGAAIGSVVPVLGTAIGGVVGGAIGGIGTALGNKTRKLNYEDEVDSQQQQMLKSQGIDNLPAQHDYRPTFAYGGGLKGAPQGKATKEDIKRFEKQYPEEMQMGVQVEYEHTKNKDLAKRIAADHIKDFEKMYGTAGYYQGLKEFGLTDELAMGGVMNSYAGGGSMSPNLDNTTVYANGGSHESNPLSGIPLGNNSLVEENEVRFNDYVFSDRIPYKHK